MPDPRDEFKTPTMYEDSMLADSMWANCRKLAGHIASNIKDMQTRDELIAELKRWAELAARASLAEDAASEASAAAVRRNRE